jgi:ABC-type transporter Mla MlaB component
VAPKPVIGGAEAPRDFSALNFEPITFPAGLKPEIAKAPDSPLKPANGKDVGKVGAKAPAAEAKAPAKSAAAAPPAAAPAPPQAAKPVTAAAPPAPPQKPKDPLAGAALAAAEGRPAEAMKWLSGELPANKEEFAWRMLFELDQRQGRRDLFEQRAIAFASRFEKSPPTWIEDDSASQSAAAGGGAVAAIAVSGALVARAAEPLRKLLEVAEQRAAVKLDLSRLKEVDDEGARLLLETLKALAQKGKECTIQGVSHAIDIATATLRLGERENESTWLLVLELLQRAHRSERFDDWAVNYAVTFEVSPPAYQPPPSDKSSDAQSAQRNATSGWPLSGEWVKEDEAAFASLEQEVAADARIVALDASELHRMDLASARALQRVLKRLAEGGHSLTINNVGYLQHPLLVLAGIPEADLALRKQ